MENYGTDIFATDSFDRVCEKVRAMIFVFIWEIAIRFVNKIDLILYIPCNIRRRIKFNPAAKYQGFINLLPVSKRAEILLIKRQIQV